MRKLSFFLTFALVLTLAYGALAQTNLGIISIDNVTNQYTPAQLSAGKTHVASIRYNFTALSAANPWVGSNCFEVYSPDGANWVNLLAADGPIVTALPVTVSKFKKYWTNANAGTVNWVQTAGGGATQPGPSTGLLSRVGYSLATLDVTGTGGFLGGATNGIALTLQLESVVGEISLARQGRDQTVMWDEPRRRKEPGG
jgi:hypothetical protein